MNDVIMIRLMMQMLVVNKKTTTREQKHEHNKTKTNEKTTTHNAVKRTRRRTVRLRRSIHDAIKYTINYANASENKNTTIEIRPMSEKRT
jgi:hypothetical protein